LGFGISDFGFVTLEIFDVSGRKVATLVGKELTPGEYAVQWNGRNDAGQAVGSGMYFYRLEVSGKETSFQQTRKMLLVR
jgi:flagellar hook assembly protein FlgD